MYYSVLGKIYSKYFEILHCKEFFIIDCYDNNLCLELFPRVNLDKYKACFVDIIIIAQSVHILCLF